MSALEVPSTWSLAPDNLDDFEDPCSPIRLPIISSTRNEYSNDKFSLQVSPRFSSMKKSFDLNATAEHSMETGVSLLNSSKTVKLRKPERQQVKSFEVGPFGRVHTEDNETIRQRLNTPFKNEKVVSEDEQRINVLGKDAVQKFYSHYKKLDKIKDVNHFYSVKDSVYTNFLSKSESLQLLPSKVGFVKDEGDGARIKLNHFRLGDKYANVLSEGLKVVNDFKKFELANNRLTQKGAEAILSRLNTNTEVLNLAGNSIGKIGCEYLGNIIQMRGSELIELNLEGNKLGDYAMAILIEAMEANHTLLKVNLGKNFLSDPTAEKLGKMIEYNQSLQELYLPWNQIKGPGGIALINGLSHNKTLRVLDLSWNSLGLHKSGFAKAFADYITVNQTLIHLDLSNNYFIKEDCKTISEGLNNNHTLYGFHFHGNIGYVDSKGFLVIPEDHYQSMMSQHIIPPINGVNIQPDSVKRYKDNWNEFKDICWICEGWYPRDYQWIPGRSGPGKEDPIYLHLSYEGFKGKFLPKEKGFRMTRMTPPCQYTYFYTVEAFQMPAEDQYQDVPRNPNIHIDIQGHKEVIHMQSVNYVEPCDLNPIIDSEYNPLIPIQPRTPDDFYVPPEFKRERPTWTIQMSVFRDYKADKEDLLDKCFEIDFDNTRITRLVKTADDLAEIKEMLHKIYKPLKDCYKYFSSIGTISDIWSIPLNAYTDFCMSSGIIDGKLLKVSDFDRIFIATYTKTDKSKNHRSPDRAVVRHQFMEGLFRLAEEKYMNGEVRTTNSQKEALKLLLEENVIPFIKNYDIQKWRLERYWLEDVDTVLKSYMPIMRGVYKRYSGAKTLPGQRPFMSLEEFQKLVGDAEMYSDKCGERDAILSFNYAMMTQVDELNSDRIFQMQLIEFCEAIARIADLYSPAPYGQPDANVPWEKRKEQSLAVKLEGCIERLYNNCVGNDVKDIWLMPATSIFEMGEVMGKQRSLGKKKQQLVRLDPTDPSSFTAYD